MSLRRHVVSLALLGVLLAPATAAAQAECQPPDHLSTCIPADSSWPQPGGGRWLNLAPTRTAPPGSVAFGLVTSFLHRPIGLTVPSPDPAGTTIFAVENLLVANFLMALGAGDLVQLTAGVPVVLFQEGAGKADIVGSDGGLVRSTVGDFRFGSGLALLRRPPGASGAALAMRFEMAVPTGDTEAFAGHPSAVYAPAATFDHRIGPFLWGLELGARLRADTQLATTKIGPQITSALGISYDILDEQWLTASAEAFGLFTLVNQLDAAGEPAAPHLPAEWLVSLQTGHFAGQRLRISLGGGGAIPLTSPAPVTMPAMRLAAALHYVPRPE